MGLGTHGVEACGIPLQPSEGLLGSGGIRLDNGSGQIPMDNRRGDTLSGVSVSVKLVNDVLLDLCEPRIALGLFEQGACSIIHHRLQFRVVLCQLQQEIDGHCVVLWSAHHLQPQDATGGSVDSHHPPMVEPASLCIWIESRTTSSPVRLVGTR